MKTSPKLFVISMAVACGLLCARQSKTEFPKMTGPYLGQKPPGDTAELFAPGIVSGGDFEHSSPVFTPDLKEIYWSTIIDRNRETVARPIFHMKMVDGMWTKPEIPSFARQFVCTEDPFITPDGKRLFFHASDSLRPEKAAVYYVERVGNGWGAPVNLGAPINGAGFSGQPTVAKNGTIYFVANSQENPDGGLYYSRAAEGGYQKPVFMEEKINKREADWTPYIAPDESYFIFCSFRKGGFGSGDLYITFKQKDGAWGRIINMGERINGPLNERFPNVTHDGKYLFFNSTRKIPGADPNGPGNGQGDMYWIDAKIIDELRQADSK